MTLTTREIAEIVESLDAEIAPEDVSLYRSRFNIAPSDQHWIVENVADQRTLVPARWGYIASGRPLINVRGEQVGSGAGFRDAFQTRRCAVVTDGFFEWTKARAPTWYHRGDGGLVLLAGLYQKPNGGQGEALPRFTVLTTRANGLVSAVHDRMPVVLPYARLDAWLADVPAVAATLIGPAPDDELVATPVSKRVNSVKNDDAACLAPAGGEASPTAAENEDRGGQRRLF